MPAYNKILDTFLFKNSGIFLKPFHVDRTFETYRFLQNRISFSDIEAVYNSIEKQLISEADEKLVRVQFDPVRPHKHTVEIKELEPVSVPVKLVITETLQRPSPASQFKFADRSQWESLLDSRPPGSDDVLLVREGQLIETSRFNLFLYDREKNLIITPTLDSGCLNGVFRRFVLSEGWLFVPGGKIKVIEDVVTADQLTEHQLYVGNSVRGLLPAEVL